MEKVTGIKSVDFKITALGHGVVNWNGSPNLTIIKDDKFKNITNHSMPKLRGYTNVKEFNDDGTAKFYKHPEEINLNDVELYISQNCIRHHLFRGEHYNLNSPQLENNIIKLLCSITGLVRGYVNPKNENKRTSPLLLTDFVDQLGNGNFEQMGRSGSKEKETSKSGKDSSNSLFSKLTFGDTKYLAYGSISIEQLQFIPLCADFGRESMKINNHKEGQEVAEQLSSYLKKLSGNSETKAVYHENYVRVGSIFDEGEAGILLNDSAIDVLVTQTIELVKNLTIRQAKGYMYVDEVLVDYNDSQVAKNMFRIKTSHEQEIKQNKGSQSYAVYYQGK
ncbi:type I-Fv CRISPR-associated protein Cas7fv [Marinomonas sp. THO17]|uniref:type I-Fv CRISPR-associated protein Cas7fv n=1 Tax=Marinomonas sp. THO17 TaxID=3149048 RepID=UPI00336BEBB4